MRQADIQHANAAPQGRQSRVENPALRALHPEPHQLPVLQRHGQRSDHSAQRQDLRLWLQHGQGRERQGQRGQGQAAPGHLLAHAEHCGQLQGRLAGEPAALEAQRRI